MIDHPFTITLTHVAGETWEEYIQRCQDVTNYVMNMGPERDPEPPIFFSDTTKWKKVGEHSYQLIDDRPEYNREAHFAGAAHLLINHLKECGYIGVDDTDDVEQCSAETARFLADFAVHILGHTRQDKLAEISDELDALGTVRYTSDMTEWIEEKGE